MSNRKKIIVVVIAVILIIVFFPRTKMTTWDFMNSNIPGSWDVKDLTLAAPTKHGLHVKTDTAGRMFRLTDLKHKVEGIRITYMTGRHTDAIFYWHPRTSPPSEMVQLPFLFTRGSDSEIAELNVSSYPQWDPLTDRIGFAFPAGTDLILQKIELVQWSFGAKIFEAFLTFWRLDGIRPYSINFVWGPLITHTSVARHMLYSKLPPLAYSANRIFYVVLGLGLITLFALKAKRSPQKKMKKAIASFFLLLGALWLLYDVRMGLEFMNYLRKDIETFHAEEPAARTFRERDHFYDFAEESLPFVMGRNRYILMAESRWPYLGLMRYFTYPSLPTNPEQVYEGVDTWLAHKRPDITMNEENQLVLSEQIISPPGKVLHQFAPGTFIFRADK